MADKEIDKPPIISPSKTRGGIFFYYFKDIERQRDADAEYYEDKLNEQVFRLGQVALKACNERVEQARAEVLKRIRGIGNKFPTKSVTQIIDLIEMNDKSGTMPEKEKGG